LLDGGQQQSDEDRDDGDHHQQLDQRERRAAGTDGARHEYLLTTPPHPTARNEAGKGARRVCGCGRSSERVGTWERTARGGGDDARRVVNRRKANRQPPTGKEWGGESARSKLIPGSNSLVWGLRPNSQPGISRVAPLFRRPRRASGTPTPGNA